MSVQSKFEDAFVSAISEVDDNKAKELSGKLHDLESELDHAVSHVVDKLKSSNSNFGIELSHSQIKEILEKTFKNIINGI